MLARARSTSCRFEEGYCARFSRHSLSVKAFSYEDGDDEQSEFQLENDSPIEARPPLRT